MRNVPSLGPTSTELRLTWAARVDLSPRLGIMDVPSIKKRWKYLKDCYIKDWKKSNEYIPSGSAAPATRKNTFRFYEAMSFLSDCMEAKQTVSTLSNLSVPSSPMSSISSVSAVNTEECSTSSSSHNFNSSKSTLTEHVNSENVRRIS
ncbi:PREDICTED: uncharacterized protein LOC105559540 [Vollenhovia emeryi]|uniref:uncharacterized protein LOC105559540 n=1 Tax=Vollenhovia emeryi TaxID=411798 RepID=UPI0005F48A9E|nr:PREDICTED: uncharacterized protein LOC105559540 [Vollenhovia emeryi]